MLADTGRVGGGHQWRQLIIHPTALVSHWLGDVITQRGGAGQVITGADTCIDCIISLIN